VGEPLALALAVGEGEALPQGLGAPLPLAAAEGESEAEAQPVGERAAPPLAVAASLVEGEPPVGVWEGLPLQLPEPAQHRQRLALRVARGRRVSLARGVAHRLCVHASVAAALALRRAQRRRRGGHRLAATLALGAGERRGECQPRERRGHRLARARPALLHGIARGQRLARGAAARGRRHPHRRRLRHALARARLRHTLWQSLARRVPHAQRQPLRQPLRERRGRRALAEPPPRLRLAALALRVALRAGQRRGAHG